MTWIEFKKYFDPHIWIKEPGFVDLWRCRVCTDEIEEVMYSLMEALGFARADS